MNKKLIFILYIFIQVFTACEDKNNTEQIPPIKNRSTLGSFLLKSKKNKIILSPKHKKIEAPLLYKDDYSNLNFNALYRITNNKGETGYFRFGWITYQDATNILSNVNWFYKQPLLSENFENYTIETVEVPSTQEGSIRICTIGDSQTWWGAASQLRMQMDKLNPDFYFIGSNVDIYDYPHEGEGGNSTESVLKRIEKIPEADFYTLLIGTNDWKNEISRAEENIKDILNFLTKKYPSSKIIYLDPLPTTNKERNRFNQNLKKRIEKIISQSPQVFICPLGEKIREKDNWAEIYLSYDGLHPNTKGVKLMAEHITIFINNNRD